MTNRSRRTRTVTIAVGGAIVVGAVIWAVTRWARR